MRRLNIVKMFLFKSITTVNHSNVNLSVMLINGDKVRTHPGTNT